jgi:hypothetical protein
MVDLSDTPAGMIARLDAAIGRRGQSIAFRRGAGAAHICRGVVRGYDVERIVGLVTLADRHVIVSPTGLGAYGIPKANEDFSTQGRTGKVQDDVEPFYVDDVLVRVEMRVRFA